MTREPEKPPARVTARDVAERAGVAISTVSKALSGRGSVRNETREQIVAIAESLGYESAQSVARRDPDRTTTIGVIISDQFGRLTVPVLIGALEALSERGIALLLFDGRGDPIREQHFADSLLRRRADGVLVIGADLHPREPLRGSTGIQAVYALSWSTSPDDTSVVSNDSDGARLATEHLVATGRHRLAFVAGARNIAANVARLDATRAVLADRDLDLAHPALFGESSEHWGRQAAYQLIRAGAEFDGVVCGSDRIARGVLDAMRESGIDVPGQVAVTGFDNWDVVVGATRPPLTSVDMNLHEVGRRAAELLLERIAQPADPAIVQVESDLVLRESSALSHGQ